MDTVEMKMAFGVRSAIGPAMVKDDPEYVEWRAMMQVCDEDR